VQIAKVVIRGLVVCVVVLLSACGGGGSRTPSPQNTIGSAGGTVDGPSGSRVVIPQGALSQGTAIAIEASSAGAPQQPAGMRAASDVFALTPHGTSFATPATVTLPFDPTRVQAGFSPSVYKTNAAQTDWERVPGPLVVANSVSVQVTSFSWFVVGLVPPQITQQPQSVSVDSGSNATFSVIAIGPAPFAYEWQRSNDGGATFLGIPGQIASTLQLGPVAAGDNGALIRVIVSNSDGATTSTAATLTVNAGDGLPTIVTEPQDQVAVISGSATFVVFASGGSLQFQWERSADGGPFAPIAGATTNTYTRANVVQDDDGDRFRVVVVNAAGSVTSRAALLTIGVPLPAAGGRIAGGSAHSVARLPAGQLVSWGTNQGGALGTGGPTDEVRTVPGQVPTISDAVALAAGGGGTLTVVLRPNGEAWGWGGFNGTTVPVQIPGVNNAIAACVGTIHSLLLLADGRVLARGGNSHGQLGDGSQLFRSTPVPVVGVEDAIAVGCGDAQSFAVLADGTVRAWGRNHFGQLGDGTQTNHSLPVTVLGLAAVVAITGGDAHSLARHANGTVSAWGRNHEGQLGDGTQTDRLTPITIPGLTAIAVEADHESSLALRSNGRVAGWGSNSRGQLGHGTYNPLIDLVTPGFSTVPVDVTGLTGVTEIALSDTHTFAVRGDGTVMAWGSNRWSKLGLGDSAPDDLVYPFPQQVVGLDLD
jgi:hypothetical protein